MPATTTESLRALLVPVVTGAGFDLEELTVTPAGRRRLLRVTVDGDRGVDLDAVAEISRVISAALDDADAFGPVAYVLEVGSPGVERPLTEARHWRRAIGRLVEVAIRTDPSAKPVPPVTGRVVSAGETAAVLDVDGTKRVVTYTDVARAQVQVEFRRPGDGADDVVDLDLDGSEDGPGDEDEPDDGHDDDTDDDDTDEDDTDEDDTDDGPVDPDAEVDDDLADDEQDPDTDGVDARAVAGGPTGPPAAAGTDPARPGPAAPDRRG